MGKNVVSQHMSWTFLPPFYCAWFSITENDIRLIRKLWFITFNNYPGRSLYSCLKWWSQWWFDPVAISLDIGKFLAAVVQWLIVINLQPCIQRVHSYFNYRWLIWEFRKYYPYTVGEARMRLFPKIWEPKHGRCSRGRPATTFFLLTNRQEWERFQCGCAWNWYIVDPYTTENIIIHTLNNPRRECWKSFTLSG